MTSEHAPVMLVETLDMLAVKPGGTYVDCTLGGGGHASAILKALEAGGRLIGIERDSDALERVRSRIGDDPRLELFRENFKNLPLILSQLGIAAVDGCLIDLGVSTPQLMTAERGFSFRNDGPLDMRMDQTQPTTAADLVNNLSQEDLAALFRRYGEERQARRLGRAIVERRRQGEFRRTRQLADVITEVKGGVRKGRIHPATQVFQALRIEVNQELTGLEDFLDRMVDRLVEAGRLVVIAFHSLEDRIVKNAFREAAGRCVCFRPVQLCECSRIERVRLLTRRPVRPGDAETSKNPRARSGRLRGVERLPRLQSIEENQDGRFQRSTNQ